MVVERSVPGPWTMAMPLAASELAFSGAEPPSVSMLLASRLTMPEFTFKVAMVCWCRRR